MHVIRASTAGFCMGVSRALRKLDEAIAMRDRPEESSGSTPLQSKGNSIYTFGPIIHNPEVVRTYELLGVRSLKDIEEVKPGDIVVIRAHGVPLLIEEQLRSRGADIIDATCTKVKAAQLLIRRAQAKTGGTLLLFGEAEHPEVQGLVSYALPGAQVFGSMEELYKLGLQRDKKYFLAAQTTQDAKEFEKVEEYLTYLGCAEVSILRTICNATHDRQEEVTTLAKQVQSMVIVGGMNSGNTRRLAEISKNLGVFTIHCENGNELPIEQLIKLQPVGLSAGASTPDEHIDAVEKILFEA